MRWVALGVAIAACRSGDAPPPPPAPAPAPVPIRADAALPSAFHAQPTGYATFAPPDHETLVALGSSKTHDRLLALTYASAYVFDANLALRATIKLPRTALEPIVIPVDGGRFDVLANDRLWVIDPAVGAIVTDVPLETSPYSTGLAGMIAIEREAPPRFDVVDASTAKLIGSAPLSAAADHELVAANDGSWATVSTRRESPVDDVQIMDVATAPRLTRLAGVTLPRIERALPAGQRVLVIGQRAHDWHVFGQVVARDGTASAQFPIDAEASVDHVVTDDGRFAVVYFASEGEDRDDRRTVIIDLSTATVVRVIKDGLVQHNVGTRPLLVGGRVIAQPRCEIVALDPADASHDGTFKLGSVTTCPNWSYLTRIGDRIAATENAKLVVALDLAAIR